MASSGDELRHDPRRGFGLAVEGWGVFVKTGALLAGVALLWVE